MVDIRSPTDWTYVPNLGQAAVIPRNQSVEFDVELNNPSKSSIQLLGIGVNFGYLNGSMSSGFLQVYGQSSLSPGQSLTVLFIYGTNSPRFPGNCCGRIVFTIFGDWEGGPITKTALLIFQ
jgi:hypothetical protein